MYLYLSFTDLFSLSATYRCLLCIISIFRFLCPLILDRSLLYSSSSSYFSLFFINRLLFSYFSYFFFHFIFHLLLAFFSSFSVYFFFHFLLILPLFILFLLSLNSSFCIIYVLFFYYFQFSYFYLPLCVSCPLGFLFLFPVPLDAASWVPCEGWRQRRRHLALGPALWRGGGVGGDGEVVVMGK